MRLTSAFKAAALAAALTALPASAIEQPPAFATIDWATFAYELIDTKVDAFGPTIEFLDHSSSTSAYAQSGGWDGSSSLNWSTDLVSASGVASATIGAGGLHAQFASAPEFGGSFAQAVRSVDFVVSANTLVTFSVAASVGMSLTLSAPGEDAYTWAYLLVNGPGYTGASTQKSGNDKELLFFANGTPRSADRLLLASFYNGTNGSLTGHLEAFAIVKAYTTAVVAVPEPETYAMLLAGVGLLAAVASRRRRRD